MVREHYEYTNDALTPQRIMAFAWGYAPTLAIEAAVRHGIFDALDNTPQRLTSKFRIARRPRTEAPDLAASCSMVFDLLAREGERFALTGESAAFLVSSKPGYHGMFFNHISNQLLPRWLQLTEIVRTGQPVINVNEQTEGAVFFAEFVESLFPISSAAAAALGEHLGVPRAVAPISVLDIGAGSGVWGISLAKQSSQVRIRAVDWPQVLTITKNSDRILGAVSHYQSPLRNRPPWVGNGDRFEVCGCNVTAVSAESGSGCWKGELTVSASLSG
jgi:3-hydroxy-5-methyl-1-naphthoate 3-O-methyltransferase